MTKPVLSLAILTVLLPGVCAPLMGAEVLVRAVEVGDAAVVPIEFDPQGAAIAAVQFDISFDPAQLRLHVHAGESLHELGKKIVVLEPTAGLLRCLIVGFGYETIPAGTIADLQISRVAEFAAGDEISFRLQSVFASDLLGTPLVPSVVQEAVTAAETGELEYFHEIRNAATIQPGPLAPGLVIAILGRHSLEGPVDPGQFQVTFDGDPAWLLGVTPDQVNCTVPETVAGKETAVMRFEGPVSSWEEVVEVITASPAIFTEGGTGLGLALAFNEGGDRNRLSAPSGTGSEVSFYASGLGVSRSDGPPYGPVAPVSVWVQGTQAEVLFVGTPTYMGMPVLPPGVTLIRIKTPREVAEATVLTLRVGVGADVSPPGTILAVADWDN